jgi:hypothetical protein
VPSYHGIYTFSFSWSKPQVEARSHPHVIDLQRWLNSLWHTGGSTDAPISLSESLAYADRFRIRRPGDEAWGIRIAHIDSPALERWEDPGYRRNFDRILEGNWREYDAFDARGYLAISAEPVRHLPLDRLIYLFLRSGARLSLFPRLALLEVLPSCSLPQST